MSATDLLAALRARGLRLECLPARPDHSAHAWRLVVSPAGKLTAAEKEALSAHREAVLDLLYRECDGAEPCSPFLWPDQAPPDREEWDEEAQQYVTVPGRKPNILCLAAVPSFVIDPPPPSVGLEIDIPPGA